MTETAVPTITPTALAGNVDLSRVHFVGVGGTGMLPLARLCAELGSTVSGSDIKETEALGALAAMGVTVHTQHAARNVLADATAVVFTHAIDEHNPEIKAAELRDIPVVHRSTVLNQVLEGRTAIGVVGTHGKSSTAGMLATGLSRMGCAPSYVVGGELDGLASGGRLGDGELFVAEVDESDRTFFNVAVDVAVVTSIEHDHPETYADLAEHVDAYEQFVKGMRPNGIVVLNADSLGCRVLAARLCLAVDGPRLVTFGTSTSATWRISQPDSRDGRGTATLTGPAGVELKLEVSVPGVHQLHNAAAVVAAVHALGLDAAELVQELRHFDGIKRRLSPVTSAPAEVRVYDSCAHHPTEITADLAAATSLAGTGRVLAVFQPGGQARLAAFGTELGQALAGADQLVITGAAAVVPASLQELASAVTDAGGTASAVEPDRADAVAAIVEAARPGDVVVLIGTGDLVDHGAHAAAWLVKKFEQSVAAA
ncbi:Mur ligase domain-containing protein [Streptomyces sp. NPDC020096]